MKSELFEAKSVMPVEKFPALYKGASGLVILVQKRTEEDYFSGFVVKPGGNYSVHGGFSDSWEADHFTRLPVGTKVILEQTA